MGGSLRRKRPYQQRCRDGFLIDDDDDAEERRSNRSWNSGSRRSLTNNGCNGHADVNGHNGVNSEMIDNVESSV